ncbi:MAG: hypothetical protein AAEJ65_00035 [Planctomycetota bacterium]
MLQFEADFFDGGNLICFEILVERTWAVGRSDASSGSIEFPDLLVTGGGSISSVTLLGLALCGGEG